MSNNENPGERTIDSTADHSLWRSATVIKDMEGALDPVAEVDDPPLAAAARYESRDLLGVGGMGEVRLCRDAAIGRDVAVKTLLRRDAGASSQRRFLREVRVQGQLEHPSIVPVYDLGADPDGGYFFTMRRVRGHTLAEVLSAVARGDEAMVRAYSRRKLLGAFVRVCLAVDYANTRGVLHRDLKPSNIMLGDFGEVYVLDWGVAKLVADAVTDAPVALSPAELVGQGSTVGTLGYMSPEQLLGEGDAQDARTDVYALGCILHEVVTLSPRHRGGDASELARVTLEDGPREPTPGVPPELDAAWVTATRRDREGRYASARELADAVERYLDGDRDSVRRRELSALRVTAARAAFDQSGAERSAEGAAKARAEAAREVTAALALDAENAEAKALLMRLLVEAPARMPPEVEVEMAERDSSERNQFARYGAIAMLTWLACVPVVVAMGVRNWEPIVASTSLVAGASAYTVWARRRGNFSAVHALAITAVALAAAASGSCWLGPFVLVPQLIAAVTVWAAAATRSRRDRRLMLAFGTAATVAPFLAEWLGLFPPAYTITADAVTLHARTVSFPAVRTVALLFYASVSTVVLPGYFLGGIRESLSDAERKLFMQAWHLRKLVDEGPATTSG